MSLRAFGTGKRRNDRRWLMVGALLATTGLAAIPEAQAQGSIVFFPEVGDNMTPYTIWAMSGNGAYLGGGYIEVNSGVYRATRWDAAGNGIDLGSGIGASSYVTGLSFDGSAASGTSYYNLAPGAFRWTEDGGIEYIGALGGNRSWALDISNDGSVVAGLARRADYRDRGFVWIKDATTGFAGNPQMHEIPTVAADDGTSIGIAALSGDGRYVTGYEVDDHSVWKSYRYDVSGIQSGVVSHIDLGDFGGSMSTPADISDDGSVIVGYSRQSVAEGGNMRAFRWVEGSTTGYAGGAMHDLGTLGGDASFAHGVSGDGKVVVGTSETSAGATYVPFRWAEDTGMIAVADWLAAAGVEVTVTLAEATVTNQDGSIVAGTMWNDEGERIAYIARVVSRPDPNPGPNPGGGLMDVQEYHRSLFSTTQIAQAGEFLAWLPMNGAHHRPLMQQGSLADGNCAWATGDLGYHGVQQASVALAEVGGCVELFGGSVVAGLGVGTSHAWQALALGGSSRLDGQYLIGEVDWQPDGTPLLLSLTGMLGGWQANLHRGYSNGAATAYSDGKTSVTAGVIRLRADWLEAASFGNTTINPWALVAFGRQHIAAFTESGGPFPAHFDAQSLGTAEVRLGVAAVTTLSAQTTLTSTLELAHRGGDAPAAKGNVIGLFGFNMGGGQYGATWLRAGLELDHQISDTIALSGSVHAATNGRDPSVSGSVGLKLSF